MSLADISSHDRPVNACTLQCGLVADFLTNDAVFCIGGVSVAAVIDPDFGLYCQREKNGVC